MYLLSILLFTFVYLLSFNSVIEENRDRYSIQTFAIVMITIFLISMPVTTTFVSLMLEENQREHRDLISFLQINSVWFAGAGGLVAIFLSALTMVRLKQKRIRHKTSNLNLIVVGLFAGVVSFASAYKHLAFFSGDDAGVFLYEAIPAIDDIDCNAPILLVKWEQAEDAEANGDNDGDSAENNGGADDATDADTDGANQQNGETEETQLHPVY